jgi:hypothetical protein|tara:strand:- start:431 stop:604 length:174 start_codon:yes stop_codon:yes gene_type:complete
MTERYEDEHGIWEQRVIEGRVKDVLVEPKVKKATKKKSASKRKAKKVSESAGSNKGN